MQQIVQITVPFEGTNRTLKAWKTADGRFFVAESAAFVTAIETLGGEIEDAPREVSETELEAEIEYFEYLEHVAKTGSQYGIFEQ